MKKICYLQNRLRFKRAMTMVFFFGAPFLAITLLAAGCHKQQPVPESGSPPALLFSEKCGICHPPFHPQAHTSTGWKNVVPRMEENAKSMGIGTLLSEEEKSIILDYLEKHARKGY